MKASRLILPLILSIVLVSCVSQPLAPTMTPLEIQALQSREYESTKEVVFPSVLSVLQDEGYTITNADIQTGLISAESPATSDTGNDFWSDLFSSDVTTNSQTKVTAFIEQIGDTTNARLNFVEVIQTSSERGQTDRADTPITDGQLYEIVFDKIENAIFVRSAS